jgi:putative ABC transport system permease protein
VRIADLLKFALSALWQQKVRTLLTTLGVVIGTCVLALSLSVGVGVRDAVNRQFRRHDQLRKIQVWPMWGPAEKTIPPAELEIKGKMSAAKRARLRQARIQRWSQKHQRGPAIPLDRERLASLAALKHVQRVLPHIQHQGRAIYENQPAEDILCAGAAPDSRTVLRRIVAGRCFPAAGSRQVLVSEYLLYLWGIVDDDQVERVIGRKVRLEFRSGGSGSNLLLTLLNPRRPGASPEEEKVLAKVIRQLPAALDKFELEAGERETLQKILQDKPGHSKETAPPVIAEKFTISGVLRLPGPGDPFGFMDMNPNSDVIIPVKTAERLLAPRQDKFNQVTVMVDSEEHVREVTEGIKKTGLGFFSLADVAERVRLNILLISFTMAFLAVVALVVAALGIINTMLMTVLERTREIGIMKAVGAGDGHIQLIFLVEGALIGLGGGALGLFCSWLASFPADAAARSVMEKQSQGPVEESLFIFPLWLSLGVPLFTGLVTTLAAVLPARRAARVSPITALRHE